MLQLLFIIEFCLCNQQQREKLQLMKENADDFLFFFLYMISSCLPSPPPLPDAKIKAH